MNMQDFITVSADFQCHIFPDTFCFSCGLCNWVRKEKEYYEEWLKANMELKRMPENIYLGSSGVIQNEKSDKEKT